MKGKSEGAIQKWVVQSKMSTGIQNQRSKASVLLCIGLVRLELGGRLAGLGPSD